MTAEPIACRIDVFAPEERPAMTEAVRDCYARVEELGELDDGWSLRFASDAETLRRVVEYISFDRRCCPFIHWALTVEPDGGPAWLAVTGPEGTKAMLRAGLEHSDLIPEAVARAAGWSLEDRAAVGERPIDALVDAMNLRARG